MTLARGSQLGPYEIVAPLGAGGMGEVYRARDKRLKRDVAVKVVPEDLARDRDALNRFEREAQAVAALSHPNILAIHDVGTEGETSYVVTELLEGETLRERVRRSPIPWRKAVEYGVAIADGLAAAHAKGIIHRDLKPENVFITTDGVVKILDFGLARIDPGSLGIPPEEQADTPTVTLDTRPGTVLGTVNYMSPEQVRGQKIDARSDIFSFGSVLYEMMAGSRAFTGESTPDTMTAILKEEPPSVLASCTDAIPEVDRVITRCVEKKPEHRIQSARDIAFALRDILMDSGPSKPATPAPKAARLSWILVGALAVVLAVVLTLWQASDVGGRRGEAITSLAVLPFTSAGGDPDTEYLSDEIPASIINNLARLSDLRVVPRGTAFRHKGQEKELATLGRELKVEAILTGRIAVLADSLIIHAELIDLANDKQLWGTKYRRTMADILAIEEDIARHISDALRLQLTYEDKARLTERYTENAEAHRAYLQGRFWWNKRTKEGFRKAIEFFDEAIRIDPTYALAYAGKAGTYSLMGYYTHRPNEVAPLAREAAEAAIRLDPMLAEGYPPLGWIHGIYGWDWETGEETVRKAIELNPRYATAHHWYGVLLLALGRFDEAEREINRARQLDPGSLIISRELASVAFFRRDFSLALQRCQHAVEMDPTFAPARKGLGDVYLSLKRYDEAIAEFRKVVELAGRAPRYAGLLGYTYGLAGRRAEAVEELRILTELSAHGEYVPAGAFGLIHVGLGNFDLAFEWFDKACEERDNALPFFKFAPILDPLRSDPRFDALVGRLNLPPYPPAPVVDPWPIVTPPAGKIMLAVLPFENLSPDPQEWFSDGMTGELIATLGRIEALGVISRTSVMQFKNTVKPLRQIARELNANKLVEGSVLRVGGRVRITVELIDAATDTHLWSNSYEDDERDIITLQNEVARAVAGEIQVKLTPQEQTRMTSARSVDPKAYEAYLRGRHWWSKRTHEGFQRAIDLFNQAVALDRSCASAFAGLADTYVLLSFYCLAPPRTVCPRAKEAAERALEIDPTSAEAYTSLGTVSMYFEWDHSAAERAFKQAIRLDPNYAPARYRYATCLTAMGRFDEARREGKRAIELDPLATIGHFNFVWSLFFERAYDEMIQHVLEAFEFAPDYAWFHALLGDAYSGKGMFDEAIASQEEGVRLSNGALLAKAGLGRTYAKAGRREEARRILGELQERARTEYVAADLFALVYAGLGDKEMTFHWLERAFEDRAGWIFFLNVDPRYDGLRDDPRFDDLLLRIGFEPTGAAAFPGAAGRDDATTTPPAGDDSIMLAVLPFDNLSNDPEQEYFVDGMTDEMITTLGRVRPQRLRVIGRTSAMRYKNSSKALGQIGRELNVGYLVDGSVRRSGNTVRISAQLLQVSDQTQLWGNSYTRDLSDVFAIQAEVAQAVAKALAVELLPGKRGMPAKIPTTISAAHDAYLRGRHFEGAWTSASLRKAIDHYEQAIEHDPDYALAYAGLAESYTRLAWYSDVRPMEAFPAAKEAVAKALELDDTLAAAHAAMGMCYMLHDWDWPAAGKALRRAIELDPGFAMGHQEYALYLEKTGQIEKALEQMKTALELDPLSLHKNVHFGWMLTQAGEYDRAIVQLKETVALAPSFAFVRPPLGFAYLGKGMHDEAIQALQEGTRLSGGHPLYRASLGFVYAKTGNEESAREVLQDVLRQADERYVRAGDIACIYAALGQDDEAFEWLERAYQEREPQLAWLKVDRRWDGVRDDPRFSELLRRIGPEVPVPTTSGSSSVPQKERTRLAVLPFERMSADPDTDYLSEEIPASIIDSLSNLSELRVIPRSTAFRCKIGDRDIASIGRDLNATAVLTGQINTRGDSLRIRAELVDVATNRQLWSQRYDRTLTDILAIERDIADRLSEALKVRLTGEDRTQLAKRSTANAQAHRAYLEGRFWWNRRSREGYNKAIELFDQAIRLDPDYALAYAGKADCYCLMVLLDSPPKECIPKAREAAERALAIDDRLAEAHTSLGWINWVYDWDWPGAERSFKRAIELNPRYATAYNWYGPFLASMGRDGEALEQISRAHQLDPGSLIINRDLGVVYDWTGQTERAIDQLRRTVQMDPHFAPAHAHLGRVYTAAGMYDEAIAELEIAADLAGGVTHVGCLGQAYARAGRTDDATRELEKLTKFAKQRDFPAFKFALIHEGLGDKEQAFEWLGKAYENREFPMAILKVAEVLSRLRDDPRFDDLIRRIGLEP